MYKMTLRAAAIVLVGIAVAAMPGTAQAQGNDMIYRSCGNVAIQSNNSYATTMPQTGPAYSCAGHVGVSMRYSNDGIGNQKWASAAGQSISTSGAGVGGWHWMCKGSCDGPYKS